MSVFAGESGEDRQIPRGRTIGNFAIRVECRSVAVAIEGMILLGSEFALAVSANGGEGLEGGAAANHEESEVAEIRVNSVRGVIGGGSGVECLLPPGARRTSAHALTTGGSGGGQTGEEKIPAVHAPRALFVRSHWEAV